MVFYGLCTVYSERMGARQPVVERRNAAMMAIDVDLQVGLCLRCAWVVPATRRTCLCGDPAACINLFLRHAQLLEKCFPVV